MSRCRIVIHREGEKRGIDVPILTELVGVNRDEYRADPKMRWFVRFNSLVTESIKAITYRQYNYHTMMSHRSQLARWLHKRLAHNYRQAHLLHPYQMALSSLRRDSCLVPDGREGVRRVEAALKELENNGVLLCYKRESRRGERNKLIDSVFTVTPTTSFVRDVKAANKRQSDTMIFGS